MDCVICKHGTTRPGLAQVTMTRGRTSVVVRDVPADVCDNCGEEYLSESVAAAVMALAEKAAAAHVEIEVLTYAA